MPSRIIINCSIFFEYLGINMGQIGINLILIIAFRVKSSDEIYQIYGSISPILNFLQNYIRCIPY